MKQALNTEPLDVPKRQLAYFAFALFLFGTMAWRYRFFVTDDTFFAFRYARNLLDGNGFAIYKGGGFYESNRPLWIVLIAAVTKLGLVPLEAARLFNVILSGAILALFSFGIGRKVDGKHLGECPLAAIILAISYPFAVWTMGGMEMILYTALLLATVLMAAQLTEGKRSPAWLMIPLVPLALTRPEGLGIIFPVLGFATLYRGSSESKATVRPLLLGIILAFLPSLVIAILWGLRSSSSANLLFDDEPVNSTMSLLGAARYLIGYFLGAPLLILALSILAFVTSGRRLGKSASRRDLVVVMAALAGFSHLAFVVIAGGDHLPGMRYLVPILPLLALMAGRSLERIPVFIAWILLGFLILSAPIEVRSERTAGYAALEWYREHPQRELLEVGESLNAIADETQTIALSEPGAIPYRSHSGIVVMATRLSPLMGFGGLTQPGLPRADQSPSKSFNTSALLKRSPDFILLAAVDDAEGLRGIWAPDDALLHSDAFHEQYSELFRWPREFAAAKLGSTPGFMILYERKEHREQER